MARTRGGGTEVVDAACGRIERRLDGDIVTVTIDGRPSSAVRLTDPTRLVFSYMQAAHAIVAAAGIGEAAAAGRGVALHLGGCACALPWAWCLTWPGFRQVVAEIDPDMVAAARAWFDLPRKPQLSLRCQDARDALATAPAGRYLVIVRDVFAAGACPADLHDGTAWRRMADALAPGGVVLANVASGRGAAQAEASRAREAGLTWVRLAGSRRALTAGKAGNIVVVAAREALPEQVVAQALARCEDAWQLMSPR